MRLCCADGEKCDIHNAFPIRGCHAWAHLATCQWEMDRGEDEYKCAVGGGEGKKRLPSKDTNAIENTGEEPKEEHVHESNCIKVWRAIGHTVQLLL